LFCPRAAFSVVVQLQTASTSGGGISCHDSKSKLKIELGMPLWIVMVYGVF
jgi:hypothetical protein